MEKKTKTPIKSYIETEKLSSACAFYPHEAKLSQLIQEALCKREGGA